ncbi:MAG TPA: putative toxin-antitoxin system toxin component, PIN family [Coriobacteriia bacterium]
MAPPRVVLDTNVIVSGVRFGGVPGAVFESARSGAIDGVISLYILGELREVLMRPQFRHEPDDVDLLAQEIAGYCDVLVTESVPDEWSSDPDDDAVVQTALLGGAPFVVTSDAHLLGLSVPNVRFVTPADLLAIVRG